MDKHDYQQLRFAIASHVSASLKDEQQAAQLVNSVMRLILQAQSAQEVKRQQARRQFLTFRRNPDIQAPSWAYRKPGTVPVLPTLR